MCFGRSVVLMSTGVGLPRLKASKPQASMENNRGRECSTYPFMFPHHRHYLPTLPCPPVSTPFQYLHHQLPLRTT
jgi:hypothetical protein